MKAKVIINDFYIPLKCSSILQQFATMKARKSHLHHSIFGTVLQPTVTTDIYTELYKLLISPLLAFCSVKPTHGDCVAIFCQGSYSWQCVVYIEKKTGFQILMKSHI